MWLIFRMRPQGGFRGKDMKIRKVHLRNFRRLQDVEIGFENDETVLVGPNNSGKTSATAAFRLFLIRSDFKLHDFSAPRISDFDAFGSQDDADGDTLPAIEMDLWFSIDPNVEFGRVFSLVPNVSADLEEVGVRLRYSVKDAGKLKSDYLSAFPLPEDGGERGSLSHYLSLADNLNRHFGRSYFALERADNGLNALPLEPEEGKRVLQSLVRVDFLDAQRNIDDREIGRSNKLSTAFAAFYEKNLEKAEVSEEANRVIDQNNDDLTQHYKKHFKDLIGVIKGLGAPSANDRDLRIVSTLSPETALKGNTSLLYIDPTLNHELPEAYNGLGFKNLIYMAIQISHFHMQWMNTEDQRPLCQVIFIEEPEVHLHPQVQQTFVSNIWDIVRQASKEAGEGHMVPQIGISTHSSHILDAVDFEKVRYFRRCEHHDENAPQATTAPNTSQVVSLRDFRPLKKSAAGKEEDEKKTLDFLKKYLRLTHCDLFFADGAVLVEGAAEKLLLPKMIEKSAPGLTTKYLTILEVGGAYASRFASLLEFLGIPYLVVTDIDAVDPNENRTICRADTGGAVTSNASLKFFLNKDAISDLRNLKPKDHILEDGACYVAFQKPVSVAGFKPDETMHGRTFEEAFVYQNIALFRGKKIDLGIPLPEGNAHDDEYEAVFKRVKSSSFKKTDFALDIASSETDWVTPSYISDGLLWLQERTSNQALPKNTL